MRPLFYPSIPKNVDILNWCSRKVLHLPVENCNATNILLYLKNVHDFDPYSPPVENFLLLSICKFDHFLTPSLKSGRLKLIFSKGGFAPSHWKLQFYQYFAVFKECALFWPLLPSCWKFFATIRRRIWPFFDPYPPKNVDVLIWCSLWKFLHLPV